MCPEHWRLSSHVGLLPGTSSLSRDGSWRVAGSTVCWCQPPPLRALSPNLAAPLCIPQVAWCPFPSGLQVHSTSQGTTSLQWVGRRTVEGDGWLYFPIFIRAQHVGPATRRRGTLELVCLACFSTHVKSQSRSLSTYEGLHRPLQMSSPEGAWRQIANEKKKTMKGQETYCRRKEVA